jgi:hypothetical protein
MQRSTYLSLFVIAATLFSQSCVYHEAPEQTCTATISYTTQVKPIIESKCAISGCHNGDNGSDFKWTDFSKLQQRAHSGLLKSKVVNHEMPPPESPQGPLTQEQIDIISCWTTQGAPQN